MAAPFNTTMQELIEMRYLWRAEIVPDNGRLIGVLGAESHTGLDAAVGVSWRGFCGEGVGGRAMSYGGAVPERLVLGGADP